MFLTQSQLNTVRQNLVEVDSSIKHTNATVISLDESTITDSNLAGSDDPDINFTASTKNKVEIRRTYKYRIYPNQKQLEQLETVLAACRFLYNCALEERKVTYEMWKRRNKGTQYTQVGNTITLLHDIVGPEATEPPKINKYSQSKQLTEFKREIEDLDNYLTENYPTEQVGKIPNLLAVRDHILRDVLNRVDKAFDAFFLRIKRGETPGYPRFRGANRYDSFTYPDAAKADNEGLDKAPGWSLHLPAERRHRKDGTATKKPMGHLTLSMGASGEVIGPIKIKLHREALGRVRTLTIHRSGNEWYACFSVTKEIELEKPPLTKPEQSQNPVGVALGIGKLLTLSTGQEIENPHYYQKNLDELTRVQKILSQKQEAKRKTRLKETKENFQNLKKARLALGKVHRRIANRRKDYLHKMSKWLVSNTNYDGIVFGDINMQAMVRRPKPVIDKEKTAEKGGEPVVYLHNGAEQKAVFNRTLLDAGWATLVNYTKYKAEGAGKLCLQLEARNISQTCCKCDYERKSEEEKLPIGESVWLCPKCGLKLERGHNTAINLLKKQFGANCATIAALLGQL